MWCYLASSAPQMHDFDLVGSNLVAWWRRLVLDEPEFRFRKTGESCTLASSSADPGLFSEARLALSSGRTAEHLAPRL